MFLSKKTLLFLFLFSLQSFLYCQLGGANRDDVRNELNLFFDGKISDYYSGEVISGATINASANGKSIAKGFSDGKGKYQLTLEFDKLYSISFSKSGYISKTITINTKGVPEDKKFKCPDVFSEITIFKPNKCIKAEILDKPIGNARYFSDKNRIDWDMTYSMPLLASLNEMLDDCEKQQEIEAKKEKEFDKIIKAADKAFEKKDWVGAIEKYNEAFEILPDRDEPKNKINAIKAEQAKIEADNKAKNQAEEDAKKAEQERIAEEKVKQEKIEAENKAKIQAEQDTKKAEQKLIAEEKIKQAKIEADNKAKIQAEENAKKTEQGRIAEEKAEARKYAEEAQGELMIEDLEEEEVQQKGTKTTNLEVISKPKGDIKKPSIKFKRRSRRLSGKKRSKVGKGKSPNVKKRMTL